MLLVLLTVFEPSVAWNRIATRGHSPLRVLLLHLLPMLLVGCAAEAYGLVHWGKPVGEGDARQTYEITSVLIYEACYLGASLLTVLGAALLLRTLADTFQRRQRPAQALTVSVFGMGPVFLARVADAFPAVNPWLSWAIGALIMMAVLYQGLPRVFHLDPAHAMGMYMSSAVLMLLLSGMVRVFMLLSAQKTLLVSAGAAS